MLRDDAIREGRILPTKEDVTRMKLDEQEHAEIKEKHSALNPKAKTAKESPAVPVPPAAAGADSKTEEKK